MPIVAMSASTWPKARWVVWVVSGSLGEVATSVRAIADMMPIAALSAAADGLEHATMLLAHAVEGSSNSEVAEAIAALSRSHVMALELLRTCESVRVRMLGVADRIAASTPAPPTQASAAATAAASLRPLSRAQRIERARQALPPGVRGAQAEGRWLGPGQDTTVIRSGTGDQWHDRARAFVDAASPRYARLGRLATHMEVKLAMRMRAEGRTDETVVIDRPVCGREDATTHQPVTCDRHLAWFLPPGARLTVIEHDGTVVTYHGKGRS